MDLYLYLMLEKRFTCVGLFRRRRGGVQALKNLTLTIPAGMYGLLGPNGAGRSTLMRMLATLQEPDEGSIRFGEIDVVRQKDEVRKKLGYITRTIVKALDQIDPRKGYVPTFAYPGDDPQRNPVLSARSGTRMRTGFHRRRRHTRGCRLPPTHRCEQMR